MPSRSSNGSAWLLFGYPSGLGALVSLQPFWAVGSKVKLLSFGQDVVVPRVARFWQVATNDRVCKVHAAVNPSNEGKHGSVGFHAQI